MLSRRLLLGLVTGLMCVLLSLLNWTLPLDRLVYDLTVRALPLSAPSDVVLVEVDDKSLSELGRWPWPRERHVDLLRKLRVAEPRALAIDIVFADRDPEYPEVDDLLAAELRQFENTVLPVYVGQLGPRGLLHEVLPVPPLRDAVGNLGHVHVEVESDGIARGVFLEEGLGTARWPHFSLALQAQTGTLPAPPPGSVSTAPTAGDTFIYRNFYNRIPLMGPAGTVPSVSYVDVARGRVAPEYLRDKVIFLGVTAVGVGDNVATAMGRMSGVELNINVFNALRQGQLIEPLSPWLGAGLGFALMFLLSVSLTLTHATRQLWYVLAALLGLVAMSVLLLHFARLWLSPVPMLLSLVIAYALWGWLRLQAVLALIRAQLNSLEEVPGLALYGVNRWNGVEAIARLLRNAGYVKRWHLYMIPAEESRDAIAGEWRHRVGASTLVISSGGERRRLELEWEPGHSDARPDLERLFPAVDSPLSQPGAEEAGADIDIAKLRAALQHVRDSRALIDEAVDNLTAGILVSDLGGELWFRNREAMALLRPTRENPGMLDLFEGLAINGHPDAGEFFRRLVLYNEAFEEEGRTVNGGRDVLIRGRIIELQLPLAIIVIDDTTAIKASERSRVEALNFLSHDLRVPMNSVLALIESARETGAAEPSDTLLDRIEAYVRTNLSYAENFVQLSRLQHTVELATELCEAQSIIDNATAQLIHSARQRRVELRPVTSDEEIWLECNRMQMERACMNLVENAVKYSPADGEVTISVQLEDELAVIEVADRGPGIAPDQREAIFEAFQQGRDAVAGVGLGLRFVSAVAGSHGGSVDVENRPGGGACFRLRIPAARL